MLDGRSHPSVHDQRSLYAWIVITYREIGTVLYVYCTSVLPYTQPALLCSICACSIVAAGGEEQGAHLRTWDSCAPPSTVRLLDTARKKSSQDGLAL
jgi:hypothetical protein